MISVSVIKKHYKVKVGAKNIVTSCDPATVTATNSLGDIVGTTTAPSGGTGNINVPNSTTNVTDQNGTPLGSVTGISGATNTQSVSVPACADGTAVLSDQFGNALGSVVVASGATENETVTLPCSSFSSFTNQFGTADAFSVMATFGVILNSSRGCAVNGNFIYLTNGNNLVKINATDFSNVATITGFATAQEIAFSPDGSQYAVVNGTGNSVRIMDTATDIQITTFPCIASPWSISYNNTGTEVIVSSFVSTTITIYNLAGTLLNTVTGFDGVIFEIRPFGVNYYVLTSNGLSGGNAQRVRVMDFATNTEQASYSLGTVTGIGTCRSLVIQGSVAWITTERNNALLIYEYDLTFTLTRSQNLGLISSGTAYGLAYNGNSVCPSLVAVLPLALTAVSIKI